MRNDNGVTQLPDHTAETSGVQPAFMHAGKVLVAIMGREFLCESHSWDVIAKALGEHSHPALRHINPATGTGHLRTSAGRPADGTWRAPRACRGAQLRRLRKKDFDARSGAWHRLHTSGTRAHRNWHNGCFVPITRREREGSLDDNALASSGHFLKEIVMRNFIYTATLVAVFALQVAMIASEFVGR